MEICRSEVLSVFLCARQNFVPREVSGRVAVVTGVLSVLIKKLINHLSCPVLVVIQIDLDHLVVSLGHLRSSERLLRLERLGETGLKNTIVRW